MATQAAPIADPISSFDIDGYLTELRGHIDRALADYLPHPPADDYLKLREAMGVAVLAGGKRIRPCIAVAACQAVGGTVQNALAAACAVEMVHAYSLVHDDLPAMDDDDFRRGKPTCHKQYGEAAAVLTGCALLTLAFEILAREGLKLEASGVRYLKAASELARAAGVDGMVGGQAMDMALKDEEPTFGSIEACHRDKTAALFAGAAALGALAGAADDNAVASLRTYGQHIGLAFQHADDLRDADFPHFHTQSLQCCKASTSAAIEVAKRFGTAGEPLIALAQVVQRRAEEAQLKEATA